MTGIPATLDGPAIRLADDQLAELAVLVAGAQAPRLVDAAAAAAMLGVPKSWVMAEARANRIPHVQLGRYVRFDPAEVEAWWRGRSKGPARRRAA